MLQPPHAGLAWVMDATLPWPPAPETMLTVTERWVGRPGIVADDRQGLCEDHWGCNRLRECTTSRIHAIQGERSPGGSLPRKTLRSLRDAFDARPGIATPVAVVL